MPEKGGRVVIGEGAARSGAGGIEGSAGIVK